ncbi:MAG: PilZ domain-containing protein [Pseudomonadota bacterium]
MSITRGSSSRERRGFVRLKVDTAMAFQIVGQTERYEGRCKNISGAGLQMETAKKLTEGMRLDVMVAAENIDLDPFRAIAEVVRVRHLPDQHTFNVGLAIKQIIS